MFRAWVESHRASLLDSLRRLGKQPIGSFFTCMVMAVALSLPMGLSLLLSNVERLGGSWQRAAQISLYLQLERQPDRRRRRCASRSRACRASRMPNTSAAIRRWKSSSSSPVWARRSRSCRKTRLPGVVLVTPNEVDKPALEALRQKLSELPKVQQAQLDLVWVERLAAILKLGDRFVFGLTVLAGFCITFGDRQYHSSSY